MMTEERSSDSQNQSELINVLKNWLLWLDKGEKLHNELKSVAKLDIDKTDRMYLYDMIYVINYARNILEKSDDTLITEYHDHLKKLLKLEE